jgi:long-chain acyl-CoA synthetase
MAGYAERAEENAETLRGGRLHTGDVGYIDQEGYVYLIDRIKDLILNGGFNVYPRMVEEAILLHPAVAEVTVCGVPDRHRGEIVKAYVRLCDGARLDAATLRAFLRDKLAPFEQPKQIEFRDQLPLSWLGKPSRRALVAEELRRLNAQPPAPPIDGQTIDGEPVDGQPVDGQPVDGQPVDGQPIYGQPLDGQPLGAGGEGAAVAEPARVS